VAEAEPLPEAVHRLAAEIARKTGETTAIGAASGVFAIFLDVVESIQPIRYFARVGDQVPIHASSVGRAIMAQYPPAERQALYRRLRFDPYADSSPMSAEAVEAELNAATERGFHQSLEEYVPGLAGVALPLPVHGRRLSVVVAGPIQRCAERRPQIAAEMAEAVARLHHDLSPA
jgi:IclR family acetate operon transcriptional repressor